MRFWSRRKKSSPPLCTKLSLETLEQRQLLSVNSIAVESGQIVRFVDSDGTRVRVMLTGPGSGTIELTNGTLNGGDIDTFTLQGTSGASRLQVSTKGGRVGGTTINELVIEKALNELSAFHQIDAPKLDFVAGGHFIADGHIADIAIRDLGTAAHIDIAGDVGRLKVRTLSDDSSIDVDGHMQRFIGNTLSDGAEVAADTLDSITAKLVHGAAFHVGAGGIGTATIGNMHDSLLSAQGDIGRVIVQGNLFGSSVVSNISPGSDGLCGTIDDIVSDPNSTGDIHYVQVNGRVGSGPGHQVQFVASGNIGDLNLGARNSNANPLVWELAASQSVPIGVFPAGLNSTFPNDEIYFAVYGEVINIPQPGQVLNGATYFLDPTTISNGAAQLTLASSMPVNANTPNLAILPSASLTTWGTALQLNVPLSGTQYTGRILISVGVPVQAQINANGTVSAPSPANLGDPSTGSFYDFLEFTVTNNGGVPNVDVDTSQVDAFGLPIGLQFNFGFTGTATAGSPIIQNISSTALQSLAQGQKIYGTNIPAGAQIHSVNTSNNSITLNANALPGSNNFFVAAIAGPVGVDAPRDVIVAGGTPQAIRAFLYDQIAGGNNNARPFVQTYAPYPISSPTPISGATNATPIVISTAATNFLQNGDLVEITGVLGNTAANGFYFISNVTTVGPTTTFQLDGSVGNGAYVSGGTWTEFMVGNRLVAPKDIVEALSSPQDPNGLNNYFNEVIDDFFTYYQNNQFSIVSSVTGLTYSGTVKLVDIDYSVGKNKYVYNGYALRLNTSGDETNYDVIYPFFTSNTPSTYTPMLTTAAAPSWIQNASQQYESASQMIFACDAIFADNVARGFTGTPSSVMGDLEDSISAAFNRGVALNAPSTWNTGWFPTDGVYNYWVQYWHNANVTYGNLAYAFPFDDKFGASTNLQENNVGQVQIDLGSWGSRTASNIEITSIVNPQFPSDPTNLFLQGPITLTAKVTGNSPTGAVLFFVNGVAINSINNSADPPQQPVGVAINGEATISALLPALPDGTTPHTYTVTAVYIGDANNMPSVAAQPLALTAPFQLGFTHGDGPLGGQVGLIVTMSGTQFDGTMEFSISHSDGSHSQVLATVPTSTNQFTHYVTIPSNLLTLTGISMVSSPVIQNVSDLTDVIVGQTITGFGVSSTVKSFTSAQLTLSQPAEHTLTNVTFTSNGYTFVGDISQGMNTVTGLLNLNNIELGSYISGDGLPAGTTISNSQQATITLNAPASHSSPANPGYTTLTSNALNAAPIITATFTPTGSNSSISTSSAYRITA